MKNIFFVGAFFASMLMLNITTAGALSIGISGGNSNIRIWLASQGHTVSGIDPTIASEFAGLDVYFSIRQLAGEANVINFVNSGGGFVSEWVSVEIIMNMFGGTSIGNNRIGTGTTIDINSVVHPVTNGIPDFASSTQTEFNWNTDISGTSLTLLGTIGGQNAIMAGSFGSGRVVGLSFDWGDFPWSGVSGSGSIDLNNLLLNSAAWASSSAQAPIPEPSTLALFTVGALGMLGFLRKQRKDKPNNQVSKESL